MKKQLLLLFICLLPLGKKAFSQNSFPAAGSAGVGTTSPDASSLFEVKSTTKGVLIPRMTKTQRDAIVAPSMGLLIYQTNNTPGFYYFDGSVWKKIISSAGANAKLSNLAATTAINVPLLPDTNDTKDLGNATSSWKDIYADGKFYLDDVPFISNINENVIVGQDAGNGITIGDANTAIGNKAMYNMNGGSNNTAVGHRALFSGGTGANNVAMGPFALYNNAASFNHAFGYESLYENTTGEMNIAMGYKSLAHNTTGKSNIAIGQEASFSTITGTSNISIGNYALHENTLGYRNIAIGDSALFQSDFADGNTAIGTHSLKSNAWGASNTAIGYETLYRNTTGGYNTVSGVYSMYSNTQGYDNTAIGAHSLYSNTYGIHNIAIGSRTMYSNTGGEFNISIGDSSLFSNTTGFKNIAIGNNALFSNTTGMLNVAVGTNSLHDNKTSSGNTAIGFNSLYSDTSGVTNTGIGAYALYHNSSGSSNTATGSTSLGSNITGAANTANGYYSLYKNTNGNNNTAIGNVSLYDNTTGNYNVACGGLSLSNNTTGSGNTALGYDAGSYNDTNTNCVFIGRDADQSVTTNFINSMAAGYASRITATNQVRIGNSTVNSIGGYANWSILSDGNFKENIKENVPGLDFINKLRPITYTVDVTKLNKFVYRNDTVDFDEASLKNKETEIQTGFIAQEVEQAAKSLDYDFSGVDKPKNADDLYGLRYAEFVVPLVKAMQETDLKNQKLENKVSQLENENNEIKKQLLQMQECIQSFCQPQQRNSNENKIENETILLVQPNPAHDVALITIEHGNNKVGSLNIKVNDMNGKVLQQFGTSGNGISSFKLNISNFAKGTYLVQLFNQNELLQTQKLIVQ